MESDLGGELAGERLVAGPRPLGPGWAHPERTTWSSCPVGHPPEGIGIVFGCIVSRAAGKVTSPVGKEPEPEIGQHAADGSVCFVAC